jgi:AcrR family transcriptional regulator
VNDRSGAALTPSVSSPRTNEDAIIAAALEAFGRQGFNGASMRDIARLAQTSLSNLYNYFASKSALLAEVLHRASDAQLSRVRGAVAHAGPGATAQLRAGVEAYVQFVLEHQFASLVGLSEVRYLSGSDRERVVQVRDGTQGIFEQIVMNGTATGEFGTPYPEDAARNIMTMCSAISTWYRLGGRLSEQALAEEYARYALALLEAELQPTTAPTAQ